MGSIIKKRRKRMSKKKHRKLLRKTRHRKAQKPASIGRVSCLTGFGPGVLGLVLSLLYLERSLVFSLVGFEFAFLKVQNRPAGRASMLGQNQVWVYRDSVAYQAQHRQVVLAVGIGIRALEADAAFLRKGLDGFALCLAMKSLANNLTGKDSILLLDDGSEPTGQAEAMRQYVCNLLGRGSH
ncbi:MAG: hypothetical protein RLZZ603_1403 [Actinomycetota bacterium]